MTKKELLKFMTTSSVIYCFVLLATMGISKITNSFHFSATTWLIACLFGCFWTRAFDKIFQKKIIKLCEEEIDSLVRDKYTNGDLNG